MGAETVRPQQDQFIQWLEERGQASEYVEWVRRRAGSASAKHTSDACPEPKQSVCSPVAPAEVSVAKKPSGRRGMSAMAVRASFVPGAALILLLPLESKLAFVLSAFVFCIAYAVMRSIRPHDEDYLLACKRVLALLNGFATGVPALIGLFALAARNDPFWAHIGGGVQLGVYLSDMLLLTELQRRILPLYVHHVAAFYFNVLVTLCGGRMSHEFLACGLCMELTNPFWYANVVLRLHVKPAPKVQAVSRLLAIYSYVLIRFCFATPAAILATVNAWLVMPPSPVGLLYLCIIAFMVWINIENLIKCARS